MPEDLLSHAKPLVHLFPLRRRINRRNTRASFQEWYHRPIRFQILHFSKLFPHYFQHSVQLLIRYRCFQLYPFQNRRFTDLGS